MSSSDAVDGAATTETGDNATQAATDEVREAILSELVGELGEAVVGSHVAAGIDITVRVTSDAWAATAEFLKDEMGFAYFGFLSAIDWLPSPFGRDMDSQVDLAVDEPSEPDPGEAMEQGLAGGETRLSGSWEGQRHRQPSSCHLEGRCGRCLHVGTELGACVRGRELA